MITDSGHKGLMPGIITAISSRSLGTVPGTPCSTDTKISFKKRVVKIASIMRSGFDPFSWFVASGWLLRCSDDARRT